MSILQSVLREKQLRRTRRLQELAEARMRCEASGQELASAQRVHDEARAALWKTMIAAELCVQRLSIARSQEVTAARSADEAAILHAKNVDRLQTLQRTLARLEKDLEKLQERWEMQRGLAAAETLKRDWREMDDWIVARRGEVR